MNEPNTRPQGSDDRRTAKRPISTAESVRDTRAFSDDEVERLCAVKGRTRTRAALARFDLCQRHLTEFLTMSDQHETPDDNQHRLLTDGGHVAPDLTDFQVQCLVEIAQIDEKPYGLAIKRGLEAYYGETQNHGRLYPNLDKLVERDLVEKSEIDKRTNRYDLSADGVRVLESRLDRYGDAVDAYHAAEADDQDHDAVVADGGDR